jgi:hypothetical protein
LTEDGARVAEMNVYRISMEKSQGKIPPTKKEMEG